MIMDLQERIILTKRFKAKGSKRVMKTVVFFLKTDAESKCY